LLKRHKRGGTLRVFRPLPFDPEGWTITASLRVNGVVYDFDVVPIDPRTRGGQPGDLGMVRLTIRASVQAAWPKAALAQYDLRATRPSEDEDEDEVAHSETDTILIGEEITHERV
jgi:hypothetical protein